MSSSSQSPLTFREFHTSFPDQESCVDFLAKVRWPKGFRCPVCSGSSAWRLACRPLWECRDCGRQTSVTSGTVMHRSRQPLTTWMYALWLLAVRKTSISALQFQRESGLRSYRTAWTMLHKLRCSLGERKTFPLHRGIVEVDESIVGGGGKGVARRLGLGGAWIVLAIERLEIDRGDKSYQASGSARAAVTFDTRATTLQGFVVDSVRAGTRVATDGWGAYKGLAERDYQLEMHVQHGKREVMDEHLPKVHLFFSNLKAWLNGTFHGASSKYLARYVDEFVYRFNRRSLPNLFDYFCRRAMQTTWTAAARLAPELTT